MRVVWSSKAEEEVAKIKLYLIDNWSQKVADNFIKEIGEKIEILDFFDQHQDPDKANY